MDYLRYYACLLMPGLGAAGFLLDRPWMGTYSFIFILVFDQIAKQDKSPRKMAHPFWGRLPLYIHMFIMVPLLYTSFFIFAAKAEAAGTIGISAAAGTILTMVWLNIVPHIPILHELGHHRNKVNRFLGYAGATLLGNTSRLTTHNRSHHVDVATPLDHDTARRGENVHTFVWRASIGTWKYILNYDKKKNKGKGILSFIFHSQAIGSVVLQAIILTAVYYLAGPITLALFAGFTYTSLIYLEALNYLQHYGLTRVMNTKVEFHHSWNHLYPAARALGYEITNHSPHHESAGSPFYKNDPVESAPQMPNSLLCLLVALLAPPLWTSVIAKPRLKNWDNAFATPGERKLASEANTVAGWPQW
ncbi:MAG: hypothetical protein ABUK01_06020 [Leptospirales bacterium]